MQMLAGAINKELNSDYDTDSTSTSTATTSKKIQPEKPTTTTQSHSRAKSSQPTIQKAMEILTAAVKSNILILNNNLLTVFPIELLKRCN